MPHISSKYLMYIDLYQNPLFHRYLPNHKIKLTILWVCVPTNKLCFHQYWEIETVAVMAGVTLLCFWSTHLSTEKNFAKYCHRNSINQFLITVVLLADKFGWWYWLNQRIVFFGNLHYFYKFFVMTCVCTEGNKNNNKNNNTNDDQDKKGNDNDEDDNDKDDNSRQRGCVHDDNNDPTIMAIMPSIICCKKWMKNVMR